MLIIKMSENLDIVIDLWNQHYQELAAAFRLKIERTQRKELGQYRLLYNDEAPHTPSPITGTAFSNFEDTAEFFNTQDTNTVLCWIDFDNEEIMKEKPSEESKEICDEEVEDSLHPLFINPVPWTTGHVYLSLFPDEHLPQAISTELLTLALNTFRLFRGTSMRLGYDSLGANTDTNHLHFDVIFLNEIGLSQFPIEKSPKTLLLESTLQHKDVDEINMFTVGVRLFQVEYPAKCLVITPNQEVSDAAVSEASESIGNVAGMVVNYFIENNIPHSIMMSGNGLELYIFPRNFQSAFEIGKASFLDLSGVGCTYERTVFDNLTGPEFEDYLKALSCDNETWRKMSSYIQNLLSSLYF
ncbi:unnamed protein product [Blepharisma stoltei]|uniref:GDP-D-glucose phosphorylase 1 n=1 Tax=Blepharisma stoltei TaxID=1481888 RepID=A0AAU9JHA4_9CILI|nr:unnamed protein product [Blepharisma stoltei]